MTRSHSPSSRERRTAKAKARQAAAARRWAQIDAALNRAIEADPGSDVIPKLRHASDLALQAHAAAAHTVFLTQIALDAEAAQCSLAGDEIARQISFWMPGRPGHQKDLRTQAQAVAEAEAEPQIDQR